jgi:hypothetical protein
VKGKKPSPPVLAKEEWDFCGCPSAEAHECFDWELARHCEAIKKDVAKLRHEAKSDGFDELLKFLGTKILSALNRRRMAIFYYCPEFPKRPYLSVDRKERERRLLAAWGDDTQARAHLLDARWAPFGVPPNLGALVGRAAASRKEGKPGKEPVHREMWEETAVLKINWQEPDPEIQRHFEAWLHENRPSDIKPWPAQGHGVPATKQKIRLKWLGAWRLLESMNWKDAADLSQNETGKSLFDHQSKWTDARKTVQRWLSEQNKFFEKAKKPF